MTMTLSVSDIYLIILQYLKKMVGLLIPRSFIIFTNFSVSINLLKICPYLYTIQTMFLFLVFLIVSCSCTIVMASLHFSFFSAFSFNSSFLYLSPSTIDHMSSSLTFSLLFLVFLFTLSSQFRTCDQNKI